MAQVLAKGADELLIALQTPTRRGHLGVPVLLWGKPGQGKTTFVESLERPGFPVLTLIASIHDPTDFGGLPVHCDGRVRMIPPEWALAFETAGQGILLLDELTTAPPSVQAALLRVVLERRVGMHQLPAQVRIVAAANPPDAVLGGWELSPPLANRFVHLNWDLPGSLLADALRDGFQAPQLPVIDPEIHREAAAHWSVLVGAFLRRIPNAAYTQPAEGECAFATPRTWLDFAISLMASCEVLQLAPRPGTAGSRAFYSLLEGCVGSGAATSFVGFVKNMQLPDPNLVLDGKQQVDIASLKDDELHVLFSSMATCLLQRKTAQDGRLLDATLATLRLASQVSSRGRLDTVFAPVRQMVLGQTLQAAAIDAHQEGRLPEFQRQLQDLFSDTPLAEYVQLLSKSRGKPPWNEPK